MGLRNKQGKLGAVPAIGLISLAALILSLLLANTAPVRSLELDLRDYRFRLRGSLPIEESPLIILAIDDQSDDSVPARWPWPRAFFGKVIENLNRAGAAVIGVDVIFDQPDRHGEASDQAFADVISAHSNVVLSGKLETRSGLYSATSLRSPFSLFLETGCDWGLVSTEVDRDGIFRQYLLIHEHMDSTYLSFALEVLKRYREYSDETLPELTESTVIFGRDTIPKVDQAAMLINYAGPALSFPTIPFDNVLDDQTFSLAFPYDMDAFDDPGDEELGIPPGLLHSGLLKGKIVLIGATMKELQDYFPTPYLETLEGDAVVKRLTPGVEIHANAIETILSGRYLRTVSPLINLFLMIALVLLIGTLTRYVRTLWAGLLASFIAVFVVGISFYLFVRTGLFVNITTPLTVIGFSFVGNTLYQYVLSLREKRMIQGAFSHYVPEKVVSQILSNPDSLTLGGEEREVTVLFSDIAGFTTISESLSPGALVALLNEYLTDMCEVILENEGIIDKFEGDAIMAEFGVPIPTPNHAEQACRAALGMQNRLELLRNKWRSENRPLITMRVGINTGQAIVGNMGSKDVFDYTVIGDSVNLGARLEGANKFFGTGIMISEYTRNGLSDEFIVRKLDTLQVKGKAEPVGVYELAGLKAVGLKPERQASLDAYDRGLTCYENREWAEAVKYFSECLKRGKDQPAEMMLQKSQDYLKKSPGPDWRPVTVLTEK